MMRQFHTLLLGTVLCTGLSYADWTLASSNELAPLSGSELTCKRRWTAEERAKAVERSTWVCRDCGARTPNNKYYCNGCRRRR